MNADRANIVFLLIDVSVKIELTVTVVSVTCQECWQAATTWQLWW